RMAPAVSMNPYPPSSRTGANPSEKSPAEAKCRCGRADSDAAGAEAADMAAEKRRSFRIRPSDPCDAAVTMYAVPIAMAAARVGNRPMRNGAAQVERFSNFSEPGGENLIPSNYRHRPGSF